MEDRIKWIKYKEKEILFVDYSNLWHEDIIKIINNLYPYYEGKPDNSVLTLCDFTNSYIHSGTFKEFQKMTKVTDQASLKAACIGMTKSKKILLTFLNKFLRQNKIKAIDPIEKAKDWLIE